VSFHFDLLPIHPPPDDFESFTGYLTRLAEANGIRQINRLCVLTGLHFSAAQGLSDLPTPTGFRQLPSLTGCSVDRLHATTVYHLLRKFGRSGSLPASSYQFLRDSMVFHLRYCPHCLDEYGYISLLWRFVALRSCPQHGCDLLDRCGHCGCTVPLLSNGLRWGICPACQGDLRRCPSPMSPPEIFRAGQQAAADFTFLLTPQAWEDANGTVLERLGAQFFRLRDQQGLTIAQVVDALQVRTVVVGGMEHRDRARKGEQLADFLRYSALLGVSLASMFDRALAAPPPAPSTRWVMLDIRETVLLEQVEAALTQLGEAPLTYRWLSEQTGIHEARLHDYPSVEARVRQLQADYDRRQAAAYAHLLETVRATAAELAAAGLPVTRTALVQRTGVKAHWFWKRPELIDLLEHYAAQREACRMAQETDLYCRVEEAIQTLREQHRRVSLLAIARLVGLSDGTLRRRPALRSLLQTIPTLRVWPDDQAEEALIAQIPFLEEQLVAQGQVVTQQRVVDLLGLTSHQVDGLPRLRERLKQIPRQRRQQKQALDAVFCEQLPAVLDDLKRAGLPLTYLAIAEKLGRSVSSLSAYPRVWEMISTAIDRETTANQQCREEQALSLLHQIDTLMRDLQAAGELVTQKRISQLLGVTPGRLRYYPEVRARLEEIAEMNRRSMR
jgi:transcriptional regulator with XRE-family HTH domain